MPQTTVWALKGKSGGLFEAVQVDTSDYDELCAITSWCGGIPISDTRSEHSDVVFMLPSKYFVEGEGEVQNGDWVMKLDDDFYRLRDEVFRYIYEQAKLPPTTRPLRIQIDRHGVIRDLFFDDTGESVSLRTVGRINASDISDIDVTLMVVSPASYAEDTK